MFFNLLKLGEEGIVFLFSLCSLVFKFLSLLLGEEISLVFGVIRIFLIIFFFFVDIVLIGVFWVVIICCIIEVILLCMFCGGLVGWLFWFFLKEVKYIWIFGFDCWVMIFLIGNVFICFSNLGLICWFCLIGGMFIFGFKIFMDELIDKGLICWVLILIFVFVINVVGFMFDWCFFGIIGDFIFIIIVLGLKFLFFIRWFGLVGVFGFLELRVFFFSCFRLIFSFCFVVFVWVFFWKLIVFLVFLIGWIGLVLIFGFLGLVWLKFLCFICGFGFVSLVWRLIVVGVILIFVFWIKVIGFFVMVGFLVLICSFGFVGLIWRVGFVGLVDNFCFIFVFMVVVNIVVCLFWF